MIFINYSNSARTYYAPACLRVESDRQAVSHGIGARHGLLGGWCLNTWIGIIILLLLLFAILILIIVIDGGK